MSKEIKTGLRKEDFLEESMKLLVTYIDEDEGIAEDLLKAQGVEEEDIPSILYTINNVAAGRI